MNEREIQMIESILQSKGQLLYRVYRAFEGDIRVIGLDVHKQEHRWFTEFDNNGKLINIYERG